MTFGKRPSSGSTPRPTARPARATTAASDVAPRRSAFRDGLRFIGWYAAGLLTVALGCEALLWLGQTADRRLDAQFSTIGPVMPNLALLRTSKADGLQLSDCTMMRPVDALDHARNRFKRTDQFGSDTSRDVSELSHFLQCIAESSTRVLCDHEVRKAFASDAARILSDYKALASQMATFKAGSDANDTLTNVMRELSNAHPALGAQMRAPAEQMIGARERIISAVKTAAANGFVTKSDFGLFGNFAIKAAISETPVTRNVCAESDAK